MLIHLNDKLTITGEPYDKHIKLDSLGRMLVAS